MMVVVDGRLALGYASAGEFILNSVAFDGMMLRICLIEMVIQADSQPRKRPLVVVGGGGNSSTSIKHEFLKLTVQLKDLRVYSICS